MDTILNASHNEIEYDKRLNGVQNCHFRVPNQLMFPPELKGSYEICQNPRDHQKTSQFKSILPEITYSDLSVTQSSVKSIGFNLNTHENNIAALQQALTRYNHRAQLHDRRLYNQSKTIQRSNTNLGCSITHTPTISDTTLATNSNVRIEGFFFFVIIVVFCFNINTITIMGSESTYSSNDSDKDQ
jgi:hypothetical protein